MFVVVRSSVKVNMYSRKLKSSFVNYTDFESILTKSENKEHNTD